MEKLAKNHEQIVLEIRSRRIDLVMQSASLQLMDILKGPNIDCDLFFDDVGFDETDDLIVVQTPNAVLNYLKSGELVFMTVPNGQFKLPISGIVKSFGTDFIEPVDSKN